MEQACQGRYKLGQPAYARLGLAQDESCQPKILLSDRQGPIQYMHLKLMHHRSVDRPWGAWQGWPTKTIRTTPVNTAWQQARTSTYQNNIQIHAILIHTRPNTLPDKLVDTSHTFCPPRHSPPLLNSNLCTTSHKRRHIGNHCLAACARLMG